MLAISAYRSTRPTYRSCLAGMVVWATVAVLLSTGTVFGQQAPVHYYHPGSMPPGMVGQMQLQRGGPVIGYFQPVKIIAPAGAAICYAVDGQFQTPQPAPLVAGFLVGQVYRLRVIGIPLHPGMEVFPTLEVIDRLYTPAGHEWQFPIEVELTLEDLEMALSGKFVTKVIYLEDPRLALPVAQQGHQRWFEVAPGGDPLAMADQLGRPVAIVRLGARLPNAENGPDMDFLYGCPPVVPQPQPPGEETTRSPRQRQWQQVGIRPAAFGRPATASRWSQPLLSAMANPPVPHTIIR